ncbi:MAG: translation elongation factor Ts [Leptospiraceae bacterium]|nr:translation elongation factor Ts [Leptospiraceae bacterium]MDW7976688.1 translation elongation factor Ts [Leptospiraceae bacterium]
MYTPSTEEIKKLREMTGAGITDCKAALIETNGDIEKAIEVLRKKGIAKAAKKMDRATNQGLIASYIHTNGQIGSLVEVNCETDFVSRNEEFYQLAQDLAIQVAAYNPLSILPEDLDPAIVEKEKEIIREQLRNEGKPENIIEKIVEGKIQKFYEEVCLLKQPFYKDEKKTVEEYIKEHIAKFGENIRVSRFARFQVGS